MAGAAADPGQGSCAPASPGEKGCAEQVAARLQAPPDLLHCPLGIADHVKAAVGKKEIRLAVSERHLGHVRREELDLAQRARFRAVSRAYPRTRRCSAGVPRRSLGAEDRREL